MGRNAKARKAKQKAKGTVPVWQQEQNATAKMLRLKETRQTGFTAVNTEQLWAEIRFDLANQGIGLPLYMSQILDWAESHREPNIRSAIEAALLEDGDLIPVLSVNHWSTPGRITVHLVDMATLKKVYPIAATRLELQRATIRQFSQKGCERYVYPYVVAVFDSKGVEGDFVYQLCSVFSPNPVPHIPKRSEMKTMRLSLFPS